MPEETFDSLKKIYEQGFDLDRISNSEKGVLFLKIRSLTKEKLKELCLENGLIEEGQKLSEWRLREIAFDNSTNVQLNDFIVNNADDPMSQETRESLIAGVKEVEEHSPSVFLDSFDSAIKKVVRDKSITSLSDLEQKLEDLSSKLKAYLNWSWYNQKTSDLTEETFKTNDKIIPTLRKVHAVDFFIKSEPLDIPVDLKISFLPKEFIHDYEEQGKTIEQIIEMVKSNNKVLADWLYTNQNPRLFNNNIRFLIILIDRQNTSDSWKLKADYELIKEKVDSFLSNIDRSKLIRVEYVYDKDDRFAGDYKTSCFLLIIEKN